MVSVISGLLHVADERLAFVDRHIGVTHPGGEIVHHVSGGESHPAPVPGHADMVDEFAADAHDADTIGHERLGANVTARRADADPVEVPDPLLLGERSEERRVGKACRSWRASAAWSSQV